MKHQIILLGKDITSVYHGIKEFGPDHVHLLCTNETKEVAAPLFPLLPDGIRRTLYRTEPYDGEHVRNVCRKYTKRILPPNLPTTCRKVPK